MSSAVAFVSYRSPTADGDGGNHRTYQILTDLQHEFGPDGVRTLSIEDWYAGSRVEPGDRLTRSRSTELMDRVRHRIARMTENPYRLLSREGWSHSAKFGTRGVLSREFLEAYVQLGRRERRFELCVVDHPMLDEIRQINAESGIRTIIAPQNLESLDVGRVQLGSTLSMQKATVDFANELRAYSRYADRWAISKVECGVITGVGMTCKFYPYLPVGEVRARLRQIAEERARRTPDQSLFLLMGTANHAPTRRSLEWFLRHARQGGLPAGACVALVGSKVVELLPHGESIHGVEVLGRVSDQELVDLMVRAEAAIVPQRMGFGAVTRITELACAGVPVLTLPHAAFAIDVPPGVHVMADESWSSLSEGICRLMQERRAVDPAEYEAWEQAQSKPIGKSLRALAAVC